MFNPFSKFEGRLIPKFRELKKRYLVSQIFTRDNDLFKEDGVISLLLTHYDDPGLAKIHFNALSGDKYAAIIDLENEKHRSRIETMLKDENAYHLFSSLVLNNKILEDALDTIFTDKIRAYISRNTTWRIGSNKTIKPKLEITFGELFVVLKYSGQTIKVTLQEIEGY